MRTFAIDKNGNIDVESRAVIVIDKANALKEAIQQKYSMFFGEYFLDKRLGVPYYENILIKKFNLSNVETILKRVLYSFDDIYAITIFNVEYSSSSRSLSVDFACTTQYGSITDEVII